MREILFAVFVSISLMACSSTVTDSIVAGNTQPANKSADTALTSVPLPDEEEIDDGGRDSYKWLSHDMRLVDVVVHVKITKVKSDGSAYEPTDCVNNVGPGYCLYKLTAEVKEIFKGKLNSKIITFYATADASYPKEAYLRESVEFLTWGKNDSGQLNLGVHLENSARLLKPDIIEKLRQINSKTYPVDENDKYNPYSLRSIKENFETADAVVYADVVSFKSFNQNDQYSSGATLKAKVIEVFKGNLKVGDTFEYEDDLLYRQTNKEDLGKQILYLQTASSTKDRDFTKDYASEGWILYGILDKLRQISKQ